MSWLTLGVQERYTGVSNTVAANIIKDVGMVVANPYARYVWRGHGSVDYTLHHSLQRRLARAGVPDTEALVAGAEKALIARARAAGYDQFANRTLGDVELVALLQHQGAATRFIDVTPDPFIALFFACEHAGSSESSAALVALLVQDDWLIRPNRVVADDPNCLDHLDAQREPEERSASAVYCVQTPYLDERMKAQRGQFLLGRRPTDAGKQQWSSLDLPILERDIERERITRLLAPSRGAPPAGGNRPPLIVFRIRPTVRASLRAQLAERFGYTTETIYPDLNGFALAFSQFAPLQ
jgi:hypothetical protein